MKTTITKSPFQIVSICEDRCGWVRALFFYPAPSVCPNCGANTGTAVGRIVFEKKTRMFGLSSTIKIVGFEEREEINKEQKPVITFRCDSSEYKDNVSKSLKALQDLTG